MMSVLRSRQEAKLPRQYRKKKGMGIVPAGEGPRGGLQVYPARQSYNTRRYLRCSSLIRLFLSGPRALIGTTDTKRAGEVGVPPPGPQTATPECSTPRVQGELSVPLSACKNHPPPRQWGLVLKLAPPWRGFLARVIREEDIKRLRAHEHTGRPLGDEEFLATLEQNHRPSMPSLGAILLSYIGRV